MSRILVIQLCRLGDLLQTTPMLRGIRRAHPDAHVTLLVLDGFSDAPIPGHLYDALAVFPYDAVAADLRPGGAWQDAVATIRGFVRSLDEQPFDLVLNVTGSELANLLSGSVRATEVRGGLIAPDRTRVVRHPWMTYFWSSLLAREFGAVNLVDLFSRVAEVPIDGGGLEIAVPASAEVGVERLLGDRGRPDGAPLVALQLGASEERKRWQPERFAAMANQLPRGFGAVVLVGSRGERELAARAIGELRRPYVDATGHTTVQELAALLRRCRLLITNDTGTMHVATAVGTPVLDLSTGPVFVHETGPYAVGSLAVEPASTCFPCAAGAVCRHVSCREDLMPCDIADVARYALEGGPLPRPARARVLQAARAVSGRLEFRALWDPSQAQSERVRHAFARMWERSLGAAVPLPDAVGTDVPVATAGSAAAEALQGLEGRAREAQAAARALGRASATRLSELGRALEARLEHELTMAAVAPVITPLVAYLRTALESLTDRSVASLAAAYAREWAATAQRARWLREDLAVQSGVRGSDPALVARSS
jgi:ADP-heptose:LPS heptosyltransferase